MQQLLELPNELSYRKHYESIYCTKPVMTHDGYSVRFRKRDFDHAFFETDRRTGIKTNIFSFNRARYIDWILLALQDPNAQMYLGWDRKHKTIDHNRRVTIICNRFAVVIAILSRLKKQARFVTAYPPDPTAIAKMQSQPDWI